MAQSHTDGQRIDIETILDRPYGAWRWYIFALCGIAMAMEGFDMYMLGAIVPALAAGLAVEPAAISAVFVAQGIGLALGYAFIAPLADRVGRKPIVILCVLGFGLVTLVTALASTLTAVSLLRLVAFAFFGGITPNIIAMVAEISPRHIRPRQIILVTACFAFGSAMGSALAPLIVHRLDWWGAFLAGGAAPLLLLPVLIFTLPESPRFLVTAGRSTAQVNRVLRHITREVSDTAHYFLDEPPAGRASLKSVFAEGRLAMTLLFMLAGGMMMFVGNAVASWAPTFWHMQAGFPMADAAALFALSSVGAIVWPFIMIALVGWIGVKRTLLFCYFAGGTSMLVYMVQPFTPALAAFMAIAFGAFVVGSISGLYAFISAAYPTQIRSTALGWTAGAGRLLAIIGPATGGWLLAQGVGPFGVALAFGLPLFIAGIAVAFVRSKA
ncbi:MULTISPECIES: MFS transporter [unclassified Sphingobium]|uniref:MFS transporter n=1 Tax=unclassified Sphingobium TaxID=2611147 RepID=UPI002224E607|nr:MULTISPECIES: MFS transporter [unclassified Sphingobium]MCW2349493.1 AAHS family 4-hydroxybenzoate transporter-like MFS transporter [Sphingobium sp. B12D2B]MCW2368596.1 AAHS family 4-hydroxybenzoate transporter-like MFS transporter [Sphingobium sp. B11D3D]